MEAYRLAILKCSPGDAYNIGGNTTITVGQFLNLLKEKSRVKIISKVDPGLLRPSDVTLQIPNCRNFILPPVGLLNIVLRIALTIFLNIGESVFERLQILNCQSVYVTAILMGHRMRICSTLYMARLQPLAVFFQNVPWIETCSKICQS